MMKAIAILLCAGLAVPVWADGTSIVVNTSKPKKKASTAAHAAGAGAAASSHDKGFQSKVPSKRVPVPVPVQPPAGSAGNSEKVNPGGPSGNGGTSGGVAPDQWSRCPAGTYAQATGNPIQPYVCMKPDSGGTSGATGGSNCPAGTVAVHNAGNGIQPYRCVKSDNGGVPGTTGPDGWSTCPAGTVATRNPGNPIQPYICAGTAPHAACGPGEYWGGTQCRSAAEANTNCATLTGAERSACLSSPDDFSRR